MGLTVQCPGCRQQFAADLSLAGRQLACPSCGGAIQVPQAAAAVPPTQVPLPQQPYPQPSPAQPSPAQQAAQSLQVTCGQCRQSFQATPQLAGRQVGCPSCGGRIQVPPLRPPAVTAPAPVSGTVGGNAAVVGGNLGGGPYAAASSPPAQPPAAAKTTLGASAGGYGELQGGYSPTTAPTAAPSTAPTTAPPPNAGGAGVPGTAPSKPARRGGSQTGGGLLKIFLAVGGGVLALLVCGVLGFGAVRLFSAAAGSFGPQQGGPPQIPGSPAATPSPIGRPPTAAGGGSGADEGDIVSRLQSEDRQVVRTALFSLRPDQAKDRRDEVARLVLKLATQKSAPDLEMVAVGKLKDWATPAIRKELIAALDDERFGLRQAVLRSLESLKDAESAKAIAARLANNRDRAWAAMSLGRMGQVAEEALIEQADHAEYRVRIQVCRLLGEVGTTNSIPTLSRLSKTDDHRLVRTVAAATLRKVESANRK